MGAVVAARMTGALPRCQSEFLRGCSAAAGPYGNLRPRTGTTMEEEYTKPSLVAGYSRAVSPGPDALHHATRRAARPSDVIRRDNRSTKLVELLREAQR